MAAENPPQVWRFGDCEVDEGLYELRRGGRRVPMEPKVFDVLCHLIRHREQERPTDSYTTRLFEAGPKRIAQKVGEEGVETALAGAAGDRAELAEEAADLVYHLLVLLRSKEISISDVSALLAQRHGVQRAP